MEREAFEQPVSLVQEFEKYLPILCIGDGHAKVD